MASRAQSDHIWDSSGQITSTGSANAYVIAITEQIGAYYQGMPPIRFKANFSNTGSATANIVTENAPGGLGAVTLKKGGGSTNLAAGDIANGGIYTLSHDGTNFQVLELQPTITGVTGFPLSAPGDYWGVLPFVQTDGVMEIGRYLDFHATDGDATDYAIRVEANATGVNLFMTPSAGSDAGVLKRFVTVVSSTIVQGDILYFDGNQFVRLAPGTSGNLLQTLGAAANPQWATQAQIFSFLGIRYALINQGANNNLSGTYSRTLTTVTVTATAHGLQVGHVVNLDFTTGAATDGEFTVATVADANTFTITHGASGTTSGDVTLLRHTVTASVGVANVTDRGTGQSAINFSSAAASANYALLGTAHDADAGGDFIASPPNTPLNTALVGYMNVQNAGAAASDSPRLTVLSMGG